MSDRVEIAAEWALWGKEPSGLSYRVLRCSNGRLNGAGFTRIMQRYSTGTPTDLPQVTLNWANAEGETYIGMAVQRWTDERDHTGRRIAMTHYCALPYSRIPDPVAYEALYHAMSGWEPPQEDVPTTVELPVLRPETLAPRVTEDAMCVAALLLTGEPVHIVPSGQIPPYLERLRFLDAVAALLPYGMRTGLSAATWTSSTSRSHIRLAFTRHVGENAHAVRLGVRPELPRDWQSIAPPYANLLSDNADTPERAADLIRRLAAQRTPLKFDGAGARHALDLLRAQVAAPEPRPPARGDAEDVVRRTEEALYACRHAMLHDQAITAPLGRLQQAQGRLFDEAQRDRLWRIVLDEELLTDERGAVGDKDLDELYEACLRLGRGPWIDIPHIQVIDEDLEGAPSPRLLRAMQRITTDRLAALVIAIRLRADVTGLLPGVTSLDLVRLAVTQGRRDVLDTVHAELRARGERDDDPSIAHALASFGYLAGPIEEHYDEVRDKYRLLRGLFAAAYGPELGPSEFAEIVRGRELYPPTPALVLAALSMYYPAPDTVDRLASSFFRGFLESAALPADFQRWVNEIFTRRPVPPGSGQAPSGPVVPPPEPQQQGILQKINPLKKRHRPNHDDARL